MEEKITRRVRRRSLYILLALAAVFTVYVFRLFQIQIVDGPTYAARRTASTRIELPLNATRGEILDRNLQPMVVNTTRYAVIFDYNYFPHGSSEEARAEQNRIITVLQKLLTAAEESWNDTLPISQTQPYTFAEGRDGAVSRLKEYLRLADYATAENCMAALVERYELGEYTPERQRLLAGVQYEMYLREFSADMPYTFATSVSKETSYQIGESSRRLSGVEVQLNPVREYKTGTLAAHLIGTVGLLDADEYDLYKGLGYSYNDTIGKSGIEQAMESALRGTAGIRTLYKDASGQVLSEEVTRAPVPGSTVISTLDLSLQKAVEEALNSVGLRMRAEGDPYGDGKDIQSGAAVVLDVRSNAVLACASWPTFDISTYYEQYEELLNAPYNPLFNRALYGGFAPGSTFKPAMAIAALNENEITKDYTFYCGSWYDYFRNEGLRIHCMSNHGNANVVYALGKSCNSFFCEMGRLLGIDRMNAYCRQLGLGVRTGIEVGESAGLLAGAEARAAVGDVWYPADSVQAAIGQSDNMITPIQLATYVSTIANRGTRYKTHLIHSTIAYDGTETVVEPVVEEQMNVRDDVWDTVKQGMLLTASNGTATRFFVGADYTFAAKTGTAEAGNGGSDHGAFIAYAPADNPQIAVAVLMENGTATASGRAARLIMDAYFNGQQSGVEATPEGELLH